MTVHAYGLYASSPLAPFLSQLSAHVPVSVLAALHIDVGTQCLPVDRIARQHHIVSGTARVVDCTGIALLRRVVVGSLVEDSVAEGIVRLRRRRTGIRCRRGIVVVRLSSVCPSVTS